MKAISRHGAPNVYICVYGFMCYIFTCSNAHICVCLFACFEHSSTVWSHASWVCVTDMNSTYSQKFGHTFSFFEKIFLYFFYFLDVDNTFFVQYIISY